jgi:2'-5' RNA ligase
MRAFVAIELESSIKDGISAVLAGLRRLDCAVRWVRPEGIHLTLKFLGEISPDRALRVRSEMDRVAARHSGMSLEVAGTGTFPPKSRSPRVIWIGVTQNSALARLQADLDKRLEKLGFEREKRRFHPHLTVGRIKAPRGLEPLMEALSRHAETSFGRMTVSHLTLFESTLKPTGAEYSRIHASELI